MNVSPVPLFSPFCAILLLVLFAGCTASSFHDPAYDEANRAMDSNYKQSVRIMDAYAAVLLERMKAREITQEKAKALIRLKSTELLADLDKADRDIADGYERSISRGRSLTCMSTTSYNSAFTTCN